MATYNVNANFTYNLDYDVAYVTVGALATITCTLPDNTDYEGKTIWVKTANGSGLGGTINIVPNAGQTIDGASSYSIGLLSALLGGAVQLKAHGTIWMVMSRV